MRPNVCELQTKRTLGSSQKIGDTSILFDVWHVKTENNSWKIF